MFGNHIFKCTHICKIGIHNAFHDGFAQALAPVLSTAGFVPPNSTVDTEPNLYLPSDPHSRPFDLSFDPYLAPPPLTSHGCTSHTVGANITISSLPPKLPLHSNSPDVLQIITANANSHLQKYECKMHFNYHSRQHSHWRPTSLKHATDPLCNRHSRQVWPISPKLPLRPPPSTTTSVSTVQTKCQSNVHKITAISKSQRHPSLGGSQLVPPSHTTFLWTLLSCTHSFYHHCTVEGFHIRAAYRMAREHKPRKGLFGNWI
jgi:hypothetical protein